MFVEVRGQVLRREEKQRCGSASCELRSPVTLAVSEDGSLSGAQPLCLMS